MYFICLFFAYLESEWVLFFIWIRLLPTSCCLCVHIKPVCEITYFMECVIGYSDITTAAGCVSKCAWPPATMPAYILGIDLGTTSIKVALLEKTSRTVAASHILPTTAEILDDSDIKVSTLKSVNYINTYGLTSLYKCFTRRKSSTPVGS